MKTYLLAGAVMLAAAGVMPQASFAASGPHTKMPSLGAGESLVEPAQYRRRCWAWRRECRFRWGYGWRFRRCMARHGCW